MVLLYAITVVLISLDIRSIQPDNLGMYLALPVVIACGGSWMVKKHLIADGDFAGIRERVAEAVALVRRLRGGGT